MAGGSTFETAVFTYTNVSEGRIDVSENATIHYTGLEPINAQIAVNDLTLDYTASDETITIRGDTPSQVDLVSTAAGNSFFNNPLNSLTLSNSGGDDAVIIESLSSDFAAGLIMDAESIQITNNALNLGSLDLTGGNVQINQSVQTSGDVRISADSVDIVESTLTALDATISITARAGALAIGQLNAGSSGAVTLDAPAGAITDGNAATVNVIANVLTATAQGLIDLDTTIASLVASTSAAGAIDINETDAIVLTDVNSANGSIAVAAGGQITATDVQSLTDDDANDIYLTTSSGVLWAEPLMLEPRVM